jgi:phosphoglycerate dehydrogenase-like enzyme
MTPPKAGPALGQAVCVPDEDQRARLLAAGSPYTGEVLAWDGGGTPPPEIAKTTFLVAPYRATALEPEQLAYMPRLQLIQLLSAGFEAWAEVVPRGVTLCSGRGLHGSSTAELAVAGILMHLHGHVQLLEQQRRGEWRPLPRSSCSGRKVLVIGAGDIGSTVADVLTTLGATVTLIGRTARPGVLAQESLPELLPEQDVIVLSMPLTEDTRGLVDADFLRRLRPGCILVNVARGGIVVTGALVDALRAGRVKAVLDVADPEPLPSDHPLWAAPGLILTPHVGGGAEGWERRATALVLDQLARLADRRPLRNVVMDGASSDP